MIPLAVGYLFTIAAATIAWWALVLTRDAVRALFVPAGMTKTWLYGFVVADAVAYGGTAIAAGVGLLRRRSWGYVLLWAHAGAAAYAGLTCVTVSVMTDSAWWGAVLMLPAAVASAALAWRLAPSRLSND